MARNLNPLAPCSSLAEVLSKHPQLNAFGLGVYDPRSKSVEQREEELRRDRLELAAREVQVLEVTAWLGEHLSAIKTPTVGSYALKHLVENRIGRYVMNGEAIAAALIVGYPHRYATPNMLFGMSKRDLNRMSET